MGEIIDALDFGVIIHPTLKKDISGINAGRISIG
jgi:hypothetical protein